MQEFSHKDMVKAIDKAIKEVGNQDKYLQKGEWFYPYPNSRPHLHWSNTYIGINGKKITHSDKFSGIQRVMSVLERQSERGSQGYFQQVKKVLKRAMQILNEKDSEEDARYGRKILKGGGGGTSIIFGVCMAVCIALIAGGAIAVGYRSIRPDQTFVLPSVAGLCAALITGMIALQLFRKLL